MKALVGSFGVHTVLLWRDGMCGAIGSLVDAQTKAPITSSAVVCACCIGLGLYTFEDIPLDVSHFLFYYSSLIT